MERCRREVVAHVISARSDGRMDGGISEFRRVCVSFEDTQLHQHQAKKRSYVVGYVLILTGSADGTGIQTPRLPCIVCKIYVNAWVAARRLSSSRFRSATSPPRLETPRFLGRMLR